MITNYVFPWSYRFFLGEILTLDKDDMGILALTFSQTLCLSLLTTLDLLRALKITITYHRF
jgi:hypothetical protein